MRAGSVESTALRTGAPSNTRGPRAARPRPRRGCSNRRDRSPIVPSASSAPPGPDARGSIRRGNGSSPRRSATSRPSRGSTLKLYQSYDGRERRRDARELEHERDARPASARARISASARSLRVTLRSPKAIDTQSNARSANGSASALHCTVGSATPAIEQLVAAGGEHRAVDVGVHDDACRRPHARRRAARGRRCRRRGRARARPRARRRRSTAKRFHSRCMPRRHQVVHQVVACRRPSRTRRARGASSRRARPARSRSAAIRSSDQRSRRRASRRIAARAGGGEALQVAPPQLVLAHAEVVQVVPRIDARVVAVGERGAHRVVADRLDVW